MRSLKPALALMACFLLFSASTLAQGVTTSSMKGKVVDASGEPVFAATVVAMHTPTGTQYGTITTDDGLFAIRNMRVGGPYEVRVTYVGFEDYVESDIYLQLNKTADLDISMSESVVALEEVAITYDKNDVINSDRTGAMTNISREEITALPSIKRTQMDLTRMTPESDGFSFGGRNNLYNNFSLDGSIFNNPFGLDYPQPGGQTDAQPVSFDAIEQIQVSLAPFDVREGGFTGAGINAVTKSGSNEVSATAYYYFRNENLIGKKVGDVDVPNVDFAGKLFGATVGGPIIKNKLFFFLSAEAERRNELAHGWVADNGSNTGQANVSTVLESDIRAVQQRYLNYWNYDPGAYQGYYHETYNNKFLAKLDFNLTQNHNMILRYNMLDSYKDILPHPEAIIGRGPTSFRLPFENSSYRIFNVIHSVVGEVHSRFSNKISNKLLVGWTGFRDKRDPKSVPYPVNDIFIGGNLSITAGSEMFSTHNRLNQNVFQFTDNLTIYQDRHTITAGVNFEKFYFENSFNLFYYPWNMFFGVQSFLDNLSSDDPGFDPNTHVDFDGQVAASQANDYIWSYVDVAQLGIYVQDDWAATDQLNITLGLRMDLPLYFNEIPQSAATDEAKNFTGWVDENGNSISVDGTKWPDPVPLWSPRLGINYDVKGDNTIQIRGGTGIFSGRIPFVWLGNQSSNPGINPGYTFQVNATANDFHWPQVWKTNAAVDAKVGKGMILTLEGIFGKDINAVVHRNYNMRAPTGNLSGTGDTRATFADFPEVNIYSADASSIGFLEAGTIVLNNVAEGYQASVTGKVAKRFDFGLNTTLAYTWLSTKDYTSIPAEIAADAFQRSPVVGNPNFPQFSWSRYGLNHRVVGSAYYNRQYGFMASTLGLFLEVGKGNRYSYAYAGDINNDAIPNNDLLYVPTGSSDINFGTVDGNGDGVQAADAASQWTALDAFIGQDPYLSERRGQYADRNGASLPWFAQIDLRYMHDFNFDVGGKVNTLQLSLDLLNVGNLLNSSWGVRKLPRNMTPVTVNGVDNNGTPWLQFDTNLTESFVDDFSVLSKWQIQFGVRYIFN